MSFKGVDFDALFKQFFGFERKSGPTYYDPVTQKIVGANKGSLAYWHEKGHMEYEKRPEMMNKDYSRQSMSKCVIFFLVVSLFVPIVKWFVLGFFIANVYYALYEEYWCWKYAFYKFGKQKRKVPKPEVLRFI